MLQVTIWEELAKNTPHKALNNALINVSADLGVHQLPRQTSPDMNANNQPARERNYRN